MKNLVLILILICLHFNLMAQNFVYDSKGTKKTFKSEDIDIVFKPNESVLFPGKEVASALIAMLPTIIDMSFQLTTKILENRGKKFTAEYTKSKSYLEAGTAKVPNIKFVRTVSFDGNSVEALSICKFRTKTDRHSVLMRTPIPE